MDYSVDAPSYFKGFISGAAIVGSLYLPYMFQGLRASAHESVRLARNAEILTYQIDSGEMVPKDLLSSQEEELIDAKRNLFSRFLMGKKQTRRLNEILKEI